jgi:hypothetical protein
MTTRMLAIGFLFASVSAAFAQTAPVPALSTREPLGFLTRAAFSVSFAGMQNDDPRFSWVNHSRGDLDLFSYRQGRVNLFIDTELVIGNERRAFDLNHATVIVESSSSYRFGPLDVAVVARHESRHVVDRHFDGVPAWNTVGARAGRVFITRQSTIDVGLEYGRVVQHTFVDYTWTSQLTIRVDRPLRPTVRAFASGRGGFVGVDRAVLNRGRQRGARAEGGVHVVGKRAGIDLFAAYERRIDGHPTSRDPSSWGELGFRLGAQ